MVGKRLLIALALLALLAAGVLAGSWWLLATQQGQHRLLAEITRRTAVTIKAERVEGRLLDQLRLAAVTINWPGGEARCATLELRWRPLALLRGQLAIDELSLANSKVSWDAPATAVEHDAALNWPRLDGWPLRLGASIKALTIDALELHPPTGEIVTIDRLRTSLTWRDGVLTTENLDAAMNGYHLEGEAAAGFRRPQLRLDLRLRLPVTTGGIDGVSLQADLAPAAASHMIGPVTLRGHLGTEASLQLSGELGMRGDALTLQHFELARLGRQGTLRGTAEVLFAEAGVAWNLRADLADLDLAVELGVTTALSGRLEATGTADAYRGQLTLANHAEGWQAIRLAGPFSGDAAAIDFTGLAGSWLDGQLAGTLRLAWDEGLNLTGTLRGRSLDPAVISPEWPGRVNFDLTGEFFRQAMDPLQGRLQGHLFDSTLRGQPLTGNVDAAWIGNDLRFAVCELHGDGFDLSGHGRLAERLDYSVTVSRLSGVIPAAHGTLSAKGWLRWRDDTLAGEFDGHGRHLVYDGLSIEAVDLQLAGSLPEHDIDLLLRWPGGELRASAVGGWQNDRWNGSITRFDGQDGAAGPWRLLAPAELEAAAGHLRLVTLRLAGREGEALRLDADLAWQPWHGTAAAQWQGLDLARLNPWMARTVLTGRSGGHARVQLQADGTLDLAGRIESAGQVRHGDLQLSVRRAASEFAWNADGLRAALEAELEGRGQLSAHLNSTQPARLALPEQGHFTAEWADLDLVRLQPLLPDGIDLAGRLRGTTAGEWGAGRQLDLTGEAAIDAGRLGWRNTKGEVAADLRTARLDWAWRGDALSGGLQLALAEHGEARGSFRLPLPAQLPAVMNPTGPLQLALNARVRERGLLTAFFPGLIAASHGELVVQTEARGTWQNPDLGGSVRLTGAGAYFPAAGIELKDVALTGELAGDELRIASFSASSGRGQVNGSGSVRLRDWRPVAYRGTLSGERFTAINLPELELLISPELALEGTPERLQVRGEIRVPELVVIGREPRRGVLRESPDVIVVGAQAQAERSFPIALDMRVQIKLGDRVLVKAVGIDARLTGSTELRITGSGDITANGEIQVAQGIYSTYGVQLKIERGRLLYAGGPVDQPTFDILALRTVGKVKAGVHLGGTPRHSLVKLYSDPAMPDTDVLSYIVLGQPLGAGSAQPGLLSAAAGVVLSHGQSVMLQEQIKRQLGIDVIEVEGSDDVAGSMVTVGKYLSPKLYLSYGQALFTNASEVRLRYNLTPKWELESRTTGEKSGVDLFYLIEFD